MKSLFGKSNSQEVSDVSTSHVSRTKDVGLHRVFVFKDEKSNTYGPPFTMETRGSLIRMIQDELRSGQAVWTKHPLDFSVFEVGYYDVYSGELHPHETKNVLGLVQDFKISSDVQ